MRKLLFLFLVLIAAVAGVWAWNRASSEPASGTADTRVSPRATAAEPKSERRPTRPPLRSSRCPRDLSGCRAVRGRVVLVESVDPDGDGDLHVVVTGGGVTAPGVTSVDVAPALRPRRDPRIGDEVSAAGQVQRGSFGQSQIHAVDLHVRRR